MVFFLGFLRTIYTSACSPSTTVCNSPIECTSPLPDHSSLLSILFFSDCFSITLMRWFLISSHFPNFVPYWELDFWLYYKVTALREFIAGLPKKMLYEEGALTNVNVVITIFLTSASPTVKNNVIFPLGYIVLPAKPKRKSRLAPTCTHANPSGQKPQEIWYWPSFQSPIILDWLHNLPEHHYGGHGCLPYLEAQNWSRDSFIEWLYPLPNIFQL